MAPSFRLWAPETGIEKSPLFYATRLYLVKVTPIIWRPEQGGTCTSVLERTISKTVTANKNQNVSFVKNTFF